MDLIVVFMGLNLLINFIAILVLGWINFRIYFISKDILKVSVDLLNETVIIKKDTKHIKGETILIKDETVDMHKTIGKDIDYG
tara:strand:+ start:63 stop:311 length:249 start_codon:yes stop_codon:yes gene_type:complete